MPRRVYSSLLRCLIIRAIIPSLFLVVIFLQLQVCFDQLSNFLRRLEVDQDRLLLCLAKWKRDSCSAAD